MKKAMFVVMVLVVLALPGIGQAQEPSDNGTVPPFTLWLPMMGDISLISLSCPYQATGPGYLYGPVYWSEYPQGYLAVSLVNQIEVEEERDLYTLGIDIVIATDSEMKDVVAFTTASYRIKYGIFEATPYNGRTPE